MAGESILVIDDTPPNLRLARLVLRTAGYDVRTAANAEEALIELETFTPALIVMDVQLPGIDGLELTRRLKRGPRRQHILVLALTAYAMKGDEQKARDAGCDGYLTKPIDADALPRAVGLLIAQRAAGAPA